MALKSEQAQDSLRQQVHDFWNAQACGAGVTQRARFSLPYFEEIENYRYEVEPEIFSFAQFSRAYGLQALEIGVGAGTDFLQWVRSGARAYGCDLTWEAIANTHQRLDVYGLKCGGLVQGDAENLPYADNTFDLVYSWGVLHHTPDTWRAMGEVIRVARSGGACKVMLYNRHSSRAVRLWLGHCLMKGRPWRSLRWVIYHHMESLGTKAFTQKEIRGYLSRQAVTDVRVRSFPTFYDEPRSNQDLRTRASRSIAMTIAKLLGWGKTGWWWLIEFKKV